MSDAGNADDREKEDEVREEQEGEDAELEEEIDEQALVEYEPPISAIPPKVVLQEEGQVEVSASPAFQCLDEVLFDVYILHYIIVYYK